jgi:hypothetical protein
VRYYFPPVKVSHFFAEYLLERGAHTTHPQEANYFVLPFMYEIIYDYSETELSRRQLTTQDVAEMKRMAIELNELSIALGKKLIVFFYRDPLIDLPFANALVFRTSYKAALKRPHVFGLPAFVDNFATAPEQAWLPKEDMPAVFFLPTKLPHRSCP